MNVAQTAIPGVLILEPAVYPDSRGWFAEVFRADEFLAATGGPPIVQVNQSLSARGVLRGLHYQLTRPQGKLIRAVGGKIFDVAVDMRRDSPTFGRHVSAVLSDENRRQLWIPPGFAHGFYVLSERAAVVYGCTAYYDPAAERAVRWDDPDLGIPWPLLRGVTGTGRPLVSDRDARAGRFRDAECF